MTTRPPAPPKPDVLADIAKKMNDAADCNLKTAEILEKLANPEAKKLAREARKPDRQLRAIGVRRKSKV